MFMLGLRGPQNVPNVHQAEICLIPLGRGCRNIPFVESKRSKVKNETTFP